MSLGLMDFMNSRYFSWSSLFFPIRGEDPHKFWSWYPDVRHLIGVVNRSEVASPDVEDSLETTCKSVWAVQCAESQEGRRTGGQKRQKSNWVCISPKTKQTNTKNKATATCNHNLWYDVKEEPFQFLFLIFTFLDLRRQNRTRFSNNVNSGYNLYCCSYYISLTPTKNFYTDKEQHRKYRKERLVWVVCLSCCLCKNNGVDCMGILLLSAMLKGCPLNNRCSLSHRDV